MITIYVMCGLLGSGKSTWARNEVMGNDNTIAVSRDSLREMIKCGHYEFNPNTEPLIKAFRNANMEIGTKFGFDIVIDECHLTRKHRAEVIKEIRSWGSPQNNIQTKIVCIHCTESIRNVDLRMQTPRDLPRDEWEEVYQNMKSIFEPPTLEEGFDDLLIYSIPD